MNLFKTELEKKVLSSLRNSYGISNYDTYRFGNYYKQKFKEFENAISSFQSFKKYTKKVIKETFRLDCKPQQALNTLEKLVSGREKLIEEIYKNLSKKDKEIYISLLAFRILGYKKVKLSRNNDAYWNAIKKAKSLVDKKKTHNPNFLHFILNRFDLNEIGYDIVLYFTISGVATDFIIEQYAYKSNNKSIVVAEDGDCVLDLGGCWGDTALYFAHKVGPSGKVYSFEFIPENIKIFKMNLNLNPNFRKNINLIKHPVSSNGGETIYFQDNGPSSKVQFEDFEGSSGKTLTVSIDEFVETNKLTKVDFIKMDIEGAEPLALEGAINTIKKFKPKLAIAIYHNMDDFTNIPNWILDLELGYEIYIDHFKIHGEETVCFAKQKNK